MAAQEDTDSPPSAAVASHRAAREARRAEALRANLKRRKAQAQGRAAPDDPPPDDQA